MKNVFLFLLLVSSIAQADDIASRVAYQRSMHIVDAIASGEKDLKKAVEYGDEQGYSRLIQRPLMRKLQWWRELAEKDPSEFHAYSSCLSAGVQYIRYGDSFWQAPSLARDRIRQEAQKNYVQELNQCRTFLKSHPLKNP